MQEYKFSFLFSLIFLALVQQASAQESPSRTGQNPTLLQEEEGEEEEGQSLDEATQKTVGAADEVSQKGGDVADKTSKKTNDTVKQEGGRPIRSTRGINQSGNSQLNARESSFKKEHSERAHSSAIELSSSSGLPASPSIENLSSSLEGVSSLTEPTALATVPAAEADEADTTVASSDDEADEADATVASSDDEAEDDGASVASSDDEAEDDGASVASSDDEADEAEVPAEAGAPAATLGSFANYDAISQAALTTAAANMDFAGGYDQAQKFVVDMNNLFAPEEGHLNEVQIADNLSYLSSLYDVDVQRVIQGLKGQDIQVSEEIEHEAEAKERAIKAHPAYQTDAARIAGVQASHASLDGMHERYKAGGPDDWNNYGAYHHQLREAYGLLGESLPETGNLGELLNGLQTKRAELAKKGVTWWHKGALVTQYDTAIAHVQNAMAQHSIRAGLEAHAEWHHDD